MKAASQHIDKHVTSSVHPPPSLSVSPTQTCSASPSEGLLSVATVERSQAIVICSGKETTPISHDSSLAPSDEAEQLNKTTETVLAGRETKSSTDENTVCGIFSLSQHFCIIELSFSYFLPSFTKSTYEIIVQLINYLLVINQTLNRSRKQGTRPFTCTAYLNII